MAKESPIDLHTLLDNAVPERSPAFNPDGTFVHLGAAIDLLRFMVKRNTGSSHNAKICQSNIALVEALRDELKAMGIEEDAIRYEVEEYPSESGKIQATLVARIGPEADGGVVLSSHTDVIPVTTDDQKEEWHDKDKDKKITRRRDPFELSEEGEKLIGRGAVDMKHALVNYMTIARAYAGKQDELEKPVYLALSWGEEIGMKGMPMANKLLKDLSANPELIIVGEPTNEELVIGHKGASMINLEVQGFGGHSGFPDRFISASTYAAHLTLALVALQEEYKQDKYKDKDFTPSYPCINAGVISAPGTANSVTDKATVEVCTRSTGKVSLHEIETKIKEIATKFEAEMKAEVPRASEELLKSDQAVRAKIACLPEDKRADKLQKAEEQLKEAKTKLQNVGITPEVLCNEGVALSQDIEAKKPLLDRVKEGLRELGKPDVTLATEAYGTDGGALSEAFPNALTVVYGTGDIKTYNAHAPKEFNMKEDVRRGPMFPLRMIYEFCLPHGRSNFPEAWMKPSELHETAPLKNKN